MNSNDLLRDAAAYATGIARTRRPGRVDELIRMNLVDWFAVTLGARGEPAGERVAAVVNGWPPGGEDRGASVLCGGRSTAPGAALANGTLAHCLDFDDLHFPSLAHLSAPTWAAILALAEDTSTAPGAGRGNVGDTRALDAFSAGFEIGARLGSNGMGQAVTDRGWHSTGVHGRISAAVAAGVMLGLDEQAMAHAIAVAATQTSGLTTSFGTMAKPFHAGKAAMDGVLSAQLASVGFEGALDILDADRNLASALVQDGSSRMRLDGLGEHYEIERNALKPYACCGLTHAAIDCARALASEVGNRDITGVDVHTHPLATKVAAKRAPDSALAGKFSTSFCVSLALSGFAASESDFSTERLGDRRIQALERLVSVHADDTLEPLAARLDVTLTDGQRLGKHVPVSLGNPENPMAWSDLRSKFDALLAPTLGHLGGALFEELRQVGDDPGENRLKAALTLLSRNRHLQ